MNIYSPTESVVFFKTTENFGELSNMCKGFPLSINNIITMSSEILYQACKFSKHPHIQKEILFCKNSMVSKTDI